MTNVLYMFVHWKETSAGQSNISWQRNLPNRKQKPAPTSSQPQTPADLKRRQRHSCVLFSIGLALMTSVCRATPKCHEMKRQHRDQSVLRHVKDFLLLIVLRLRNGGGVMGGDRGWSQEHETTGRNVRLQQVVLHSMSLFSRKKKRKKEQKTWLGQSNQGDTVKPSARRWCVSEHTCRQQTAHWFPSSNLVFHLCLSHILNVNNDDEKIYSNVSKSLTNVYANTCTLPKHTLECPSQYMHIYTSYYSCT